MLFRSNPGFLTYSIHFDTPLGETRLAYVNSHFGACNFIKVNDCVFPDPSLPKVVKVFIEDAPTYYNNMSNNWISETIYADPESNGGHGLHTVAIYSDEYDGEITVQSTLENQVTEFTQWVDLATIQFYGDESEPVTANFNGIYTYMRFKASSNPTDKINKILVRN